MKRDAIEWAAILHELGVEKPEIEAWTPHFVEVIGPDTFSKGEEELDDFLANIVHESTKLSKLEEDLGYSAKRMTVIWPGRFPTIESAKPYEHQPVKLANKVYGGRLGNTAPGDGWKYRGSGLIMATGQVNFLFLQTVTGLPLVENPDLLRRPGIEALKVAIAWWEGKVPDSVIGNIPKTRRAVNGGDIGLADVTNMTKLAQDALHGQS